jgi:hypothetical protein
VTESKANSPWKDIYHKIGRECPQNDTERYVLKMLGAGADVADCLEYWRSKGNDEEGFLEFMKRADEWETEEIRRRNG